MKQFNNKMQLFLLSKDNNNHFINTGLKIIDTWVQLPHNVLGKLIYIPKSLENLTSNEIPWFKAH